jgi:hypothetical protein
MDNVYFDPNQRGDSSGSSLWFAFPSELQDTIHSVVTDAGNNVEPGIGKRLNEVSRAASKYSDVLWVRVGSRRYVMYRRDGFYRMGCGGLDGTERPYPGDEERLVECFEGLKVGGFSDCFKFIKASG